MIIVKFSGGLGNQIYQYALYRRLTECYQNTEVKADLSDYVLYDVHHGFELDRIFGVQKRGLLKRASFTEQVRVRGEMPMVVPGALGKALEVPAAWLNHKMRQRKARMGALNILEELPVEEPTSMEAIEENASHRYHQLMNLEMQKDWYVRGFWQQECYFAELLPQLREELCFPTYQSIEDQQLATKLRDERAVSVHVRCCDYLGSIYQVLGERYYQAAMELLDQQIGNLTYYVFSDDLKRAEDMLGVHENIIYIHGHQGADSFRDLQLMSECKHHIIANSSFSSWAAYLGRCGDGITIYPSMATKLEETGKRDSENWIRLSEEST